MPGMQSRRAGRTPDLEAEARSWAKRLSELLNGTITNGVRLSAVVPSEGLCTVGRGLTKNSFTPKVIPLTVSQAQPRCFLFAVWTLALDEETARLTVTQSKCALRAGDGGEADDIFSYEYGTDPDGEYPEAHLHVAGDSPLLQQLCERTGANKRLRDLHFPVGGRRFRPSLEDVIEMLVIEGFVKSRDGWEDVIDSSRRAFLAGQLRAAVRQDPDTAREEFEALEE